MCCNSSGVDIKNLDIAIVKPYPAALEVRVQIVLMTEVLPTEFLLPIMLQKHWAPYTKAKGHSKSFCVQS